ncbi:hypothetical protein EAE96_005047 [Botrytis aclada]|nr:hypothetical protein EAE96_005047 [Botrytis aclada]
MDYSKTFSIGDLKASSTSVYAVDESKTLGSHRLAPELPNHHPHLGGKLITDADWPALKPIIHRLYIIDNLTFLKLKEALNLEFGYNITKRQFTRKVESWGFKKNFRKNERDELVKSGKIPQRFIHDSRINQKRVERLQKRNVARMGLGIESEDNEKSLVQDQDFSPKTNAIEEALLDLTPSHMIRDQNAALEDQDMVIEEIPRSDFRRDIVTPNTGDQWPFKKFAGDDAGLSWLAELFVQMEIAEVIAPTGIEPEEQGDVEEARFISGTELQELLDPCDNNLVCGGSFQAQRHNHYPAYLSARSSSLQSHNPGIHQTHWSPLFEIDIFPPSRNSRNRTPDYLIHSLASFKRMSIDLEAKLSKLERVLPANSPAIISTLECLAFVYHRIRQSKEVVMTCRKLLHARQKEQFSNTYKMVEYCLWIVDSCLALGDLKIGMNLLVILHPRIENAVDSQHPLRLHSSFLVAEIFYQLRQYREAEDTIRPVMQIALTTLGHKHLLTIRVMITLSLILRGTFRLVDADRLARYSLQVSDQSDLGGAWFESARALMHILEPQGLYTESIYLSHRLFKLSVETFDCKEHAILVHHITTAISLLNQGEAPKAVDMLRVVQKYSYAYEGQVLFMDFEASLGCALQEQGNIGEAMVCLKRSLKLAVELYGWENILVFLLFKKIFGCYEGLSRYGEVLEFYKKLLRKLKIFVEKDSPIEGWIKDIVGRIHEIRGRTREGGEGSHEDYDGKEEEAYPEDTELEGYDIHQETDEDDEAGSEISMDDLFSTNRDISRDISFRGLNIDGDFFL